MCSSGCFSTKSPQGRAADTQERPAEIVYGQSLINAHPPGPRPGRAEPGGVSLERAWRRTGGEGRDGPGRAGTHPRPYLLHQNPLNPFPGDPSGNRALATAGARHFFGELRGHEVRGHRHCTGKTTPR